MEHFSILRKYLPVIFILLGPLMHLATMIQLYGSIDLYLTVLAPLSMAIPSMILIIFGAIVILLILQMKKRLARFGLLLLSVVYLVFSIAMPFLPQSIFNIDRSFALSPWEVTWSASIIWNLLAYATLICYGLTIVGVIWLEIPRTRHPFTKAYIPWTNEHLKFRYKGTVIFILSIFIGVILFTGNQYWYTQTFTLHYTPNSQNSLEYWIDIDENDFYGNLSLISTGPFSAGDSIDINTSVLMNNSDPFYPTSFNLYDTPTYNMPNNIFADNEITAMLSAGNWTNLDNNVTWWTLSADRTVLNLTNISAGLASWLNSIVGGYLPVYVQGYFQSRLEALNETHACIVGQIPYIEGSNASVPISPSLENKIWLFYQWGIRMEAAFGCGSGYLMDYNVWAPSIISVQNLRVNGPWYFKYVIDGAMFDIETIDPTQTSDTHYTNRLTLEEEWATQTYGFNMSSPGKGAFMDEAWGLSSLSLAQYDAYQTQWNNLILNLQNNDTYPNGTQDPALRFKFVNCGTQDTLVDYIDGDPDQGRFTHNLGEGTDFAVDGYMLYRGPDETYWLYGFAQYLANKPAPAAVTNQEKLVLLGCVGSNPYTPTSPLDPGSRFQLSNGTWVTDLNGDGKANGYENLILDIMMCYSLGITHVNIWPGPGPISPGCCDYRQFAEDLVPVNQDFFVETAKLLNQSYNIQFSFLPGHEHYWDKTLTDVVMNFEAGWGLISFGIALGLIAFFSIHQIRILRKWEEHNRDKSPEPEIFIEDVPNKENL